VSCTWPVPVPHLRDTGHLLTWTSPISDNSVLSCRNHSRRLRESLHVDAGRLGLADKISIVFGVLARGLEKIAVFSDRLSSDFRADRRCLRDCGRCTQVTRRRLSVSCGVLAVILWFSSENSPYLATSHDVMSRHVTSHHVWDTPHRRVEYSTHRRGVLPASMGSIPHFR
jgi:hypothetical protein